MKSSKNNPLVSVIVPTKNSSNFLRRCLNSIKAQTYPNIEIVVVDNHSSDNTVDIAKEFTKNIYTCGPERSAQVNFGVLKSSGEYVYKVDSDFVLDPKVIEECIEKIKEGYDAVVVHNSPDTSVSWIARVRKFEVDMYKYDFTHSSARFLKKSVYINIGGFNEKITAGEDYDFQNKLNRRNFKTGFIEAEALHLGEPKNLWKHLKKYYDYGKDFVNYTSNNAKEAQTQLNIIRPVYIKHWKSFISHPIIGLEFVFYNALKFTFGGIGFLVGKVQYQNK